MSFRDLHEALRLEVVRRLDLGQLTGSELARLTGFRQAHISNFLHSKRSLSLTGLDRVLIALNLTIDNLTIAPLSADDVLLPTGQQTVSTQSHPPPELPFAAPSALYPPVYPSAQPTVLSSLYAGSGSRSPSASIPDGGFLMESSALSTSGGPRRNEDIALDLLKFVAAVTGIGRVGPASTGFTAPSPAKPEDQVTHLLDLYARCLKTVEGTPETAGH